MALIDTHSIVEDLIAGGFAKSQAETLVKLKILHYEDLASKKDLENVESLIRRDLNILDDKVDKIKTEVAEVKTEVAEVKTEVAEVKTEVAVIKNKIDTNFNWMKGIGMVIVGLLIKLVFFNN